MRTTFKIIGVIGFFLILMAAGTIDYNVEHMIADSMSTVHMIALGGVMMITGVIAGR